jgi:ribosomal protein L11 methylase PrmA
MSLLRHEAFVDHLRRTVHGLRLPARRTAWSGYERETTYSTEGAGAKQRLVERLLSAIPTGRMLDVGANRGDFSRMAEAAGHRVVAIDADWAPIEQLYRSVRASDSTITTLVVDLVSPTPAAGWGLRERPSFLERGRADTILALALVHHLAIGRNVPLGMVAELFAALAARAVVEFVPREDPMVEGLLRDREDVFDDYTMVGFRTAFDRAWEVVDEAPVSGTPRTLFRMARRR